MSTTTYGAAGGNQDQVLEAEFWTTAGYSGHLVPLKPGEKVPIAITGWNIPGGFSDKDILERAAEGCGIGVLLGQFRALDIEHTPRAGHIKTVVQKFFAATVLSWRMRDQSLSTATLFRNTELFDPVPHWQIREDDGTPLGRLLVEFRPEHTQMMVSGTRGDYGDTRLWWQPALPLAKHLPTVDRQNVEHLERVLRLELASQGVKLKAPQSQAQTQGQGQTRSRPWVRLDTEEVRGLLELIPNGDHFASREAWVAVGHAIYGATGGSAAGRDLWERWTLQVPQGDDKAWKTFWDTVRPGQVKADGASLRQIVQRINPAGMAAREFEPLVDSQPDALNTVTGKPRWLAKKVYARARMTGAGATGAYNPKNLGTLEGLMSFAQTHVPQPDLIPGVARDQQVTLLSAAPGAGKSLLVGHWAVMAALGEPWHRGGEIPAEACHVIALFSEDPKGTVGQRVLAAIEHRTPLGLASKTPPGVVFEIMTSQTLPLFNFDPKTLQICDPIPHGLHKLCDPLEAILADPDRRGRPVVLMFDMMRATMTGSENDRPTADALFNTIKAVMAEVSAAGCPCGAIITHHTTKAAARAGSGDAFTTAGSIGLEGNARHVITLEPVDTGALSSDAIRARVVKTNYGSPWTLELRKVSAIVGNAGARTVYLDEMATAGAPGVGHNSQAAAVRQGAGGLLGGTAVTGGQLDPIALDQMLDGLCEALRDASLVVTAGRRGGRGVATVEGVLIGLGHPQVAPEDADAVLRAGLGARGESDKLRVIRHRRGRLDVAQRVVRGDSVL